MERAFPVDTDDKEVMVLAAGIECEASTLRAATGPILDSANLRRSMARLFDMRQRLREVPAQSPEAAQAKARATQGRG